MPKVPTDPFTEAFEDALSPAEHRRRARAKANRQWVVEKRQELAHLLVVMLSSAAFGYLIGMLVNSR